MFNRHSQARPVVWQVTLNFAHGSAQIAAHDALASHRLSWGSVLSLLHDVAWYPAAICKEAYM